MNLRGLGFLLLDAALIAVVVLKPMTRNYDDSDQGSGSLVVMTPPLRPSYLRCGFFLAISFAVSVVLIGLKSPDLKITYNHAVARLMLAVVHDPVRVNAYAHSLLSVFQVSVLAFVVAFALAFHASLGRRLIILLHAPLFLVGSAVAEALFGLFAMVTGLPLGPTPLANVLIQYMLAGVMLLRLSFTSFQLPKKTTLPLRRGHDWWDDVILMCCVIVSIAGTSYLATILAQRFGNSSAVDSLIVFALPPYFFMFLTISLFAVRVVRRRRINPTDERPLIEVIVPAYNEELLIANLLRTLDVAAGRYGGPVRVILCDDGSPDNTIRVAEEAMARFQHATGDVILGSHRGKSGALNQALAECTADVVFRLDADCLVHPDCFLYSVPYFLADPQVGLVSAFTLPNEPYTTWIDRMRLFELIVLYGFVRPASDVVDGIYCVPGTFTAFRRQAALEAGGFIEGMYGEDVDFTYSITRLGYRAVIDTRVASYEDVPNTVRQLRVQRVRWNRGGTMSFARFIPIVTGLSGPRFWFFAGRQALRRCIMPFRLSLLTYILAIAIFSPSVHTNLARLLLIIVLRVVPSFLQSVTCTIYYRKGKELVWLPLQYVFGLLKHYYSLETFLSFNARPVVTRRLAEALRPARVAHQVEPSEA
ncbi:MAG: glycosyltransferase family 2 protein [Acidimicrobiaceae bacterium]|nr:glycosyltransferase family 2 protein [Acidimicrobiaceae bacterium]